MGSVVESVKEKNPYKRGADDGVLMGILLIAVFLSMTLSYRYPLANWTGLLLCIAGVPLLTFFLLRRSYIKDNGLTIFSALWMQGIVMFFCATLILAMFVYVYLRLLNPTFLIDMLNHVADFYEAQATPQGHNISATIHALIHQNLVPSSISVAVETIWVGVFSGSLLSALMAWVVKLKMWKNS